MYMVLYSFFIYCTIVTILNETISTHCMKNITIYSYHIFLVIKPSKTTCLNLYFDSLWSRGLLTDPISKTIHVSGSLRIH